MSLLSELEDAREQGGEFGIVQALLELVENRPLFASHQGSVNEWIMEARDLGRRTVLAPRQEVLPALRGAELFLAAGSAREAYDLAAEASGQAQRLECNGLAHRAWMTQARALVRMGRQDDAVRLLTTLGECEDAPEKEDPLVPGLAFLAVGEAHLFEGKYEGAYRPLERAAELLPASDHADRLRYDALVGLGMLDHRMAEFETAALRYSAAMRLADKHSSRPEQVESHLLMGSLCRGQGKKSVAADHLENALKLSASLSPPNHRLTFPTERLRNVVGSTSVEQMSDRAVELAGECGLQGDLMGYVQLTAIVAALKDYAKKKSEAKAMLRTVVNNLIEGGQEDAAAVLQKHLEGY